MRKSKILCSICALCLSMAFITGCNDSSSSYSTTDTAVNSSSLSDNFNNKNSRDASSSFDASSTNVAYKNYRLIVNDSLKTKDLPTQMSENNNLIPDDLYNTSVDIKAYANSEGQLVIAENISDKLTALNNITEHPEDFTTCKIESNNTMVIKTGVNDKGEVYVVMDDNVAAYQID